MFSFLRNRPHHYTRPSLQFALPLLDVSSDFYTAYTFYSSGDVVWASVTLFFILMPIILWAVVSCAIAVANKYGMCCIKCFYEKIVCFAF